MAESINVEINGLDELLEDMRKKFPDQYKDAMERAMTRSVIDVEGWAKQNAPWDTGRLRSSIGHEVKRSFGDVVGYVGSPVEYAPYVETRGTPRRGGRIPWLRPALEEHVGDILNNFKEAMDKLVNKWGD